MTQEDIRLWHGMRRDALWQLAERGVRASLGLALSVVIARTLGPANFGIYSYALATVALFAFLGQAGLDSLLMRELVRTPSRATLTLSEGLALRVGGAICAAFGSVCVAVFSASNEMRGAIPLVCILSLSGLLQAGWVVESLLLANRRFAGTAIAKVCAYAIASGLRLIALLLPTPLMYLAIATVFESFLCLTLLWSTSHRQLAIGWTSLLKPSIDHIAALAQLAAPMLLSAFTIAVYSRIDVFMLGHMIGREAAGLYTAGTLLSEGFYLIPTAVMAAASPRLTRLYTQNLDAFSSELYRFLRLLSAAGIGIALSVTLLAPHIFSILFGTDYEAAAPVLQIHIWSTWAVFVSTASDPYYINHDLRHAYLIKTSTAALLNIALNFALIPPLGPVGAAWATLMAYTSSAFLMGALFRNTRPLFNMQLRAMAGLPSYRSAAWSAMK